MTAIGVVNLDHISLEFEAFQYGYKLTYSGHKINIVKGISFKMKDAAQKLVEETESGVYFAIRDIVNRFFCHATNFHRKSIPPEAVSRLGVFWDCSQSREKVDKSKDFKILTDVLHQHGTVTVDLYLFSTKAVSVS